jgi:DNA-binding LacI/PurR family transcriptional regulator
MKMRDVAEKAGVSLTTVSRVLNGFPTVKSAYRERVLQAMAELEYQPNRLASNLRKKKAEMIGVVISSVEDAHFTHLVRAIEVNAYRQGYRVLLCNTDETIEKQRSYLEVLAAERVSGVMLSPTDPASPEITKILDLGIPLIAFDRTAADPRADSVTVNNIVALRQATEHLLALGHRKIAMIGGLTDLETGAQRQVGYETAMQAVQLVPCSINGHFTTRGGQEAIAALLSDPHPPTAVIVANNQMMIGVLHILRQRGVHVPDDLSLVLIDDPFWAELVEPPLTALAQPIQQMAESALQLLLERLQEQRQEARHLVFDFTLRIRSSCQARPLAHRHNLSIYMHGSYNVSLFQKERRQKEQDLLHKNHPFGLSLAIAWYCLSEDTALIV